MAGITIREDRVEVSGDLSVETVAPVFERQIDFAPSRNIVDLGQVGLCDSSGLALLVHWYARAEESGIELEFLNVPKKLHEIADLAGLGRLFVTAGQNRNL